MKRSRRLSVVVTAALLLAFTLTLSACTGAAAATKVRVLIVPKFESGEISGDFPGEAQKFYEGYLAGCDEVEVPNAAPSSKFYMNEENGVGMLITGSGKTATSLSMMALLGWDAYDFTDAWIVSVGCAGGSTGHNVFGDVVLVTAACDNDLGHRTDSTELDAGGEGHTWFYDSSFDDYSCQRLDRELADRCFELIQDCPLRTTEISRSVLATNFPGEEWAARDPRVMYGSAVTGDTYWKGWHNHEDATYIVETYGCDDEYAVTEMEEVAVVAAARCHGLADRVVSLRTVVNMDTFLAGETPESLWLGNDGFNETVDEGTTETLDIFEPAMENLFDAGSIVIDAALAGEL